MVISLLPPLPFHIATHDMFALLVARAAYTAPWQQLAGDFQGSPPPQGTQLISGAQACRNKQRPRAAASIIGFFRPWQRSFTTTGSLCHWWPQEVKSGNSVNYLYSRITKTTFSFSVFPEVSNCSSPAFY